jgi:hypothetical protein
MQSLHRAPNAELGYGNRHLLDLHKRASNQWIPIFHLPEQLCRRVRKKRWKSAKHVEAHLAEVSHGN